MHNPLSLAMLISGSGTTMQAIINACNSGDLNGAVKPVLVIASKPGIGGIAKAIAGGIDEKDIVVLERKLYPSAALFGEMIIAECGKRGVNFVGQYGWMPLTPANVTRHYAGRMVNQHPGPLDPGYADFGGKGMYGRRVHCARLLFSRFTSPPGLEQWTEVVSHLVTPEFDRGHVILTERVPILPKDTVDDLQKRALEAEWRVQIQTLRMFYLDTATPITRTSRLIAPHQTLDLEIAKQAAIASYPEG